MFYNLLVVFTRYILKFLSLFSEKIKKGVLGRSESFLKIKTGINESDRTIWFHCASLGEYEQGLPVFEAIKKRYPEHKIVLSFFSPSGYEIRKHSPIADVVIYLPLDTKANSKKFIALLKPELTIFVKYDIWPNYLIELQKKDYKSILISAAFRPEQIYFKWYGSIFKKALKSFNHIFTQNTETLNLLEKINYTQASFSGDTRFDRVTNQLQLNNTLDFVETFKGDHLLLVIGSSWAEDEALYLDAINNSKELKIIIAPHEIQPKKIKSLLEKINLKTGLYTNLENLDLKRTQVFILDTIGLLSKVYAYADIAYVGGAAGHSGLHNILEPATFGVPILFGTNHNKFPEAKELISCNGAMEIASSENFKTQLSKLVKDNELRRQMSHQSAQFISERKGATKTIMDFFNLNAFKC
ncbi:3-deoxy-D-manno-octulosonic acid transferase [Aurantibacter aestuarii]|uniref:3-deoxy-D-manno-octulosonic acid transferase n=1 Tax=Aurantibacter aestuarii TaxID=1266046 RepID=A0A2T1NFN0_9FLAO|nr:glycosyltransferase N-terminal domain-containing protein [Aurantibacter aestuarii]PSG91579.1 3-deoxy-D-manno-octulosonic acid transferase [Aurantibacter aestuarii]